MSWQTEFPDMIEAGPQCEELLAAGFSDESYHNDEGPSFQRHDVLGSRSFTTTVWISEATPSCRVSKYRFGMSIKHSGGNVDYADIGTDSWVVIMAIVNTFNPFRVPKRTV